MNLGLNTPTNVLRKNISFKHNKRRIFPFRCSVIDLLTNPLKKEVGSDSLWYLARVGRQEKGRCGYKSLVAGFYVWPTLRFIYTYDILPPPLFLSIIHDHFSRVIPLATFARDWPLAGSLPTLLWGHRRLGLMPKRIRSSLHSWLPIHKPIHPSLTPTAHMAHTALLGNPGFLALILL